MRLSEYEELLHLYGPGYFSGSAYPQTAEDREMIAYHNLRQNHLSDYIWTP